MVAPSPLVHVIVLNWNGWQDTLKCLHSLEMLDYPNYRVVVVDNGSTDDSVDRIKKAYPDVELIETGQNLGFARGNNIGIQLALERGADYIWLLNNDTTVDPHALTAMVEVAEEDSRIGAVGSVLYYMDGHNRIQAWGGGWVSLWWGVSRHFTSPVAVERIHYITGASLLLRKKALEEVDLLDEEYFMYWEDVDLSFRLRNRGWILAVASGAKVYHRESASLGKKNPILDYYYGYSFVRFFKKYSKLPFIPIFLAMLGRSVKRTLEGDKRRFLAMWRGVLEALMVQ